MEEVSIIINQLSKKYGDNQVLNHFTASLEEGSITIIMAPSGSGKTTLLRILAGIETADSGNINGMLNKKISMVFQEDRLCENLSSLSNVRLVCDKSISKQQIIDSLWAAGLAGSELQPVRELSGGMRRRVALVRAIMVPYDILILDEPFKGLDEENKRNMIHYTKEKCKGKTVIMVTHEESEAVLMGGKILYME